MHCAYVSKKKKKTTPLLPPKKHPKTSRETKKNQTRLSSCVCIQLYGTQLC